MFDMNELPRVESLQDLADFLRTLPANDDATAVAGFDMANPRVDDATHHPCRKAGCIMAWVKVLRPDLSREDIGLGLGYIRALDPGLASEEIADLIYPEMKTGANDATSEQAAQAVEYIAKNRVCGWAEIMRQSKGE